jgi:hypothetical protein
MESAVLKITIVDAEDLPPNDSYYVECRLGLASQKTRSIGGSEPIWGETIVFKSISDERIPL